MTRGQPWILALGLVAMTLLGVLSACSSGSMVRKVYYVPVITMDMSDDDVRLELRQGSPRPDIVSYTTTGAGFHREVYRQSGYDVESYIILDWDVSGEQRVLHDVAYMSF